MKIKLAYINETRQTVIELEVPRGTTVGEAIKLSKLLEYFPELNMVDIVCGIFSTKVQLITTVQEGDRVEIYRPLIIGPKEKRFLKVKNKKKHKI